MPTLEEIQKRVGPILIQHFDAITVDAIKDAFLEWEASQKDNRKDVGFFRNQAIQTFWSVWTEFRNALFSGKAPITFEEAIEIFSHLMRRDLDENRCRNFSEIWEPALMDDMDTFLIFARMRTDLLAEEDYRTAKSGGEKNKIVRLDKLRRLVRQNFMSTLRQTSSLQNERLQVVYFEDLKRLVSIVVEERFSTSVEELSQVIEQEVPATRSNYELLSRVRMFAASLESIVPPPAESEIEVQLIEIPQEEREEIIELVDLVEAEIDPKIVQMRTPVIDEKSLSITIELSDFEVNLPGLIKQIKKLPFNLDYPKAYQDALKNLFWKIMEVCRDNKQLGVLRGLIYQLKTYLERKTAKIVGSGANDEDRKNKLMLGALGPFEAQLSELMPSSFSSKETFSEYKGR